MGTRSIRTATGASRRTETRAATRDAIGMASRALEGARARLGFLFVSPNLDMREALHLAAMECPTATFVGCTTAGEITERGLTHGGMAVMLVAGDEKELDVESGLVGVEGAQAGRELSRRVVARKSGPRSLDLPVATSVLLVDGLSGRGEGLLERMQRETGTAHDIVGGAAGDEGMFAATYVGLGDDVSRDAAAAVHVFTKTRWGIGVDHGLHPSSAAMVVTKAEKNVVREIDGRPAFDVYRDYAERHHGRGLARESSGRFLLDHELGIMSFGEVKKARAPLSVGIDGSLRCAAEVPQGATVCILDATKDDLVNAAGRAASEAKKRLGGRSAAGVLLFDCICRGTVLEEDFRREIDAVRAVFPSVPIAGFLTYGEIARYSGRLDGWHNTAAVVAAIPS